MVTQKAEHSDTAATFRRLKTLNVRPNDILSRMAGWRWVEGRCGIDRYCSREHDAVMKCYRTTELIGTTNENAITY